MIQQKLIQDIFNLQKKYIEKTAQTIERGIETQNKTLQQLNNQQTPQQLQKRTLKATKTAINAYLDATEELLPNQKQTIQEIKTLSEDTFNTMEDANEETWEKILKNLERNIELYQETTEQNKDLLYIWIDLTIETIENIENQTVNTVEKTTETLETTQK